MDDLAAHYGVMHLRDEDWPPVPASAAYRNTNAGRRGPRVRMDETDKTCAAVLKDIVGTICAQDRCVTTAAYLQCVRCNHRCKPPPGQAPIFSQHTRGTDTPTSC